MTPTAEARALRPRPHDGPPRIALYSHDATGLGHVRRNFGLAKAISSLTPRPQTVLISGTGDAARLELPDGADLVVLPGIHKERDGRYRPRRLDPGELDRILEMRRGAITAVLDAFDPDVVVVDRYVRGFRGEIEPALERMSRRGTRILLGLRDVIDAPAAVRADWEEAGTDDALARWYDGILLFTDPAVATPLAGLPGRRPVPTRATGYLVPLDPVAGGLDPRIPDHPGERLVVCTVGGGADGRELAAAAAAAPVPPGVRLVILTGPQMPDADREGLLERSRGRDDRTIIDMLSDPRPLFERASAVVSMAGYNTATELLALSVPVLLVPRPFPRAEQRLRAEAFAAHGLADVLELEDATPDALGAWIATSVTATRVDRTRVDRRGHRAAATVVSELLSAGRR